MAQALHPIPSENIFSPTALPLSPCFVLKHRSWHRGALCGSPDLDVGPFCHELAFETCPPLAQTWCSLPICSLLQDGREQFAPTDAKAKSSASLTSKLPLCFQPRNGKYSISGLMLCRVEEDE